ncbi:MAG: signal peptidase I [Patescibacteria group bacterium]
MKKIVYISLIIIFSLIVIFLVLFWDFKFLAVQSGSMRPEIKTGSVVVIRPLLDYRIGDVITFNGSEGSVTHRIYNIEEIDNNIFYTTKGDDNNRADRNKIRKDEVIGKVVFNIPYFGYVINFVKTALGFFLIVLLPAMLIIFGEIKKIQLAKKKKINL